MISTKAKEAIKTALALVLVFWIALSAGWTNPYWAALAVVLISLDTAGQSINKGMLRLLGTVPGCIAGLVILGLAPQNRWEFIALASAWIFFTTYMSLIDKNRSYMWFVAGFVCLVVTVIGPESSENTFQHAIFRTVETAMGIIVYTLVTVFLWPVTNAGAIRKASADLMTTQAALCQCGLETMLGRRQDDKLHELHSNEVQQLGQLAQVLQAEGSESYEVYESRDLWKNFHGLSANLMESIDCWHAGFTELERIEVNTVLPNVNDFFTELDRRFKEIQRVLDGGSPADEPQPLSLTVEREAFRTLSSLDQAAVAVARAELSSLENLTRAMLGSVEKIYGYFADRTIPKAVRTSGSRGRITRLPVPDMDDLLGATYAVATLIAGYLIWIYVNPPGHAGWYQMSGTIAMAVASMPQLRATAMVKPMAATSALGIGVYVFIMPELSKFSELAVLLFICTFVVCYFLTGLTRVLGLVAITTQISIQNEQTYNFAAMANSYVFTLAAFVLVFLMSYMLRSPRPEKAVLHLLGRFFRSAEFLIAQMADDRLRRSTWIEQWKTAFYQRELQSLPAKLGAWGRAINPKLFPGNSPEQVQALVTSLQTLVYRIEQLLAAGAASEADAAVRELRQDIKAWRIGLEKAFNNWSRRPEMQPASDLDRGLKTWLAALETRVAEIVDNLRGQVSEEEGQRFYQLLGSYRGVSEAALEYARASDSIDWGEWREEKFS